MRFRTEFVALALLAATSTTWAHHSYSAEFTAGYIEVRGVISRIELANPHVNFTMNVQDATGKSSVVKVQICPLHELVPKKLTPERFKVGATVVVRGSQAKKDKALIGARSMIFPDGTVAEGLNEWSFQGVTGLSRNPPK